MPLTLDLDFADAGTYVNGTPHEAFARLRRECPVYWNVRRKEGTGFWMITRYADIAAIHRDTPRFSSRKNVALNDYDGGAAEDLIILQMDPPKHTAIRSVLTRAFTPKRIADLAPIVRFHATRAIDEVIGQGECDLFGVAATLPIRMICHLLGIPEDKALQVLDWTNRTFGRDEYSQ